MDQVKSTLIANVADPDKKNKTINDLKFKQGMDICRINRENFNRLIAEEEQRKHQGQDLIGEGKDRGIATDDQDTGRRGKEE